MFDNKAFRSALGVFPTGVVIVTAAGDPAPVGITVNSFTSVSLDPPLVMWCLDRTSNRFGKFIAATGFTISVLGIVHQEVSARLAKPGSHRLDEVNLVETELGPPALADALAVFECERYATYDGGDHAIMVGRVRRFFRQDGGAPLVFFRGRYGALASE